MIFQSNWIEERRRTVTTAIMVANQKGGVGKTTIADELMFALERRGRSVVFQNLDNQGGAVHYPSIPTGEEDYLVIDTPGNLNRDFSKWCEGADIVLFPTGASNLDLVPLQRCWNIAKEARGTKLAVVLNRYDPRRNADRDFVKFLENAGMPVWGEIPEATAFVKANARAASVHDVEPGGKADLAMERLCDRIEKEA